MEVQIISFTHDPINVLYTAAKRCHSGKKGYELVNEAFVTDKEKKESLIRKIIKLGHLSILEHVSFTFLIDDISRACSHQLVRHRLASYAQVSQRHVKVMDYPSCVPPPSIEKNEEANEIFKKTYRECLSSYLDLIMLGIPKEDARYILPNATKTALIMTVNCRELCHFFKLRCDRAAQWEIRNLAIEMYHQVKEILPCVFDDLDIDKEPEEKVKYKQTKLFEED